MHVVSNRIDPDSVKRARNTIYEAVHRPVITPSYDALRDSAMAASWRAVEAQFFGTIAASVRASVVRIIDR
jgi:hypothetical protein